MYAFLMVGVRGCEVVTTPDGDTTVVDAGAGEQEAAAWMARRAEHPPDTTRPGPAALAAAAERAQAAHAESVAAWDAELSRRMAGILSVTQGSEVRAAYERETPRPAL